VLGYRRVHGLLRFAIFRRIDCVIPDAIGYNPLPAIYLNQEREYAKAREVAAYAQRSAKWISPENLEQLKALSANR
jgi:hypothetical protein